MQGRAVRQVTYAPESLGGIRMNSLSELNQAPRVEKSDLGVGPHPTLPPGLLGSQNGSGTEDLSPSIR